jgi:hypothetical protein
MPHLYIFASNVVNHEENCTPILMIGPQRVPEHVLTADPGIKVNPKMLSAFVWVYQLYIKYQHTHTISSLSHGCINFA